MNTNGNAGGARSEETLQALGVDRESLERTRDKFETVAEQAGLAGEALAALNKMSSAINTWLPHDGSDKDAQLHQAMKAANRVRPRLAAVAATEGTTVGSRSEAATAATLRDAAAEGMIQMGLDPAVVKAGFEAAAAMEAELVELLDDLAGYVTEKISPDHGVDRGWGLLARLAKVRTAVTDPDSGQRPHVGAVGSVMSFDVTVRVDTKRLAGQVNEDDHDVVGLLSSAHSVEHGMAAAYLNRVLEGDLVVLAARPQAVVNQGNNGFHLLTIVCDGYGDLVAEAEDGTELGRETAEETEPENWNLRAAALGLVGKVLETTPEEEMSPETEAAVKKVLEGN